MASIAERLHSEVVRRGRTIEQQKRLIQRQAEEIVRLRKIAFGRHAPPLTQEGKPQLTIIGEEDVAT
jgi:hypothetical protein